LISCPAQERRPYAELKRSSPAGGFSASFSVDGRHFTAAEILSFTFDKGVKTVTFSWSGTRE